MAYGLSALQLSPPTIEPAADGGDRPLWAVMIPTFNCARYLEQTLKSVLAQAPGADRMQIEVIDDCSTQDDPETVVRNVGKGRVSFLRKPQNAGAVANFNTCINRSRGHLVHILHGDDWVADGFYDAISEASQKYPDVCLIATRTIVTDAEGHPDWIMPRVKELENGGNDVSDFFVYNRLHCAGNVVRRSFYEQHGGFRPDLIHTADYEMWVRAIHRGRAVVLPRAMGFYRVFPHNDTARLARTAANVEDFLRLHQIFAAEYAGFNSRLGTERACYMAWSQAQRFYAGGDMAAYQANLDCWKRLAPPRARIRQWVKELVGR